MNAIITADFNGFNVSFRNDAYINATAVAKQFGKMPKDFLKNEQTREYISALARHLSTRRKILVKENQLVIVQNGGNNRGTWLHPKLAIFFARWLSPEFAVWCDEQIERILGVNLGGEKTTRDDRTGLRHAVDAMVTKKGLLYPDVYKLVHQRFNVEHIDELTLEQVGEATEYLHRLMLDGEKSAEAGLVITDYEVYEIAVAAGNIQRMALMFEHIEPALRVMDSRLYGTVRTYATEYFARTSHLTKIVSRLHPLLKEDKRNQVKVAIARLL